MSWAAGTTVLELMQKQKAFIAHLDETRLERGLDDVVDGVEVRTKPLFSNRNNEFAAVLMGPDKVWFAREATFIPWNPFSGKTISESYWVWVDRPSRKDAQELLDKAGIKGRDGIIEEDPYAEPTRYHVHVDTLEQVVALWKVVPQALKDQHKADDQKLKEQEEADVRTK